MAGRYLLESGSPDGYLLEDGSGVYLLDGSPFASTLTDNFDDNSRDTAKWIVSRFKGGGFVAVTAGSVAEANQRLEVTAGTSAQGYNGYRSVDTFDMTGSAVYAQVGFSSTPTNSQEIYLSFGYDEEHNYQALLSGGNLYLQTWIFGTATNVANTAYSSTTHKWWRLRESGGTVFLDTAPSTASNPPVSGDWTNRFSVAVDPLLPVNNVYLAAGSGCYDTSTASPVTAYFDGFNAATTAATGYTLTAASGSFALTGTAANLKAARLLTAASGSYALTGTASTLKRGLKLTAAAGAYSLSGTAANFPVTRKITAAAGAFTLTGTATSLKRGLKITAASGAFALTGTAATLTKSSVNNYTLTAASGSFALSGTAATLRRGLKLSAAAGSYSLTGTAANLKRGLKLSAASGSYTLSGTAATMTQSGSRTMTALPAAFVITGSASTRRLNSAGGGGSIAFFLS